MNEIKEEHEFVPRSEEEVPPKIENGREIPTEVETDSVNLKGASLLEKIAKRTFGIESLVDKHGFKNGLQEFLTEYATFLLLACVIFILILFVVDTFIINNGGKSSSLLSPTFELFKSILLALVGYLFASKGK